MVTPRQAPRKAEARRATLAAKKEAKKLPPLNG